MPGTFIRDNRDQNMELNQRPVGRDSQPDRAAEVLLASLGGSRR
jgi:hypothetical protein